MKVIYSPLAGEPEEIEVLGRFFVAGEGLEIAEGPQLDKLKGNPMFRVGTAKPVTLPDGSGEDDKRIAKVLDGRSREAREARAKAIEADADADAKERAAAHVRALAAAREDAE